MFQEKPHKCSQCSKSFPTPGDLKSHMYVHNGLWPFRCHICSRGFSKPTNLKNHMLLHLGRCSNKKIVKSISDYWPIDNGPLDNLENPSRNLYVFCYTIVRDRNESYSSKRLSLFISLFKETRTQSLRTIQFDAQLHFNLIVSNVFNCSLHSGKISM